MHSETNAEPRACGVVVCFFVLLLVDCAGASKRQKKRRPQEQLASLFPGRDFDRVPLQNTPTSLSHIAVPPGARPRLHAPVHRVTGLNEHMLTRPPVDTTAGQNFLPEALGPFMDDDYAATARFDKKGSRKEVYDEVDEGWIKAVMDKQEKSNEEEVDLSVFAKNIARELGQQEMLLKKIEGLASGIELALNKEKKLPENEISVESYKGHDLEPMDSDFLEEGDGERHFEEDIEDMKIKEMLKGIIEDNEKEPYTEQNVKGLLVEVMKTSGGKPKFKMKTGDLIKKFVKGRDGKSAVLNTSETRNVTTDLNSKEIVKILGKVNEKPDLQDQGGALLIKITEENVKQGDDKLTGRQDEEGTRNESSSLQTQKGREPTISIKVEDIPEDTLGETGLHQNVVHGHVEEKSMKNAVDSQLPRRPEDDNGTELEVLPPPPLTMEAPVAWSKSEDSSATAVLPSVERRLNLPEIVKEAKTQNEPRYSDLKQTGPGDERNGQREIIQTKDSTEEKEGVASPAPENSDGINVAKDDAEAPASPVSTTKLETESKDLATEAKVDSKGSYFSDIASIFRVFSQEGSTDAVTYAIMMAAAMASLMLVICCLMLTCQMRCCKRNLLLLPALSLSLAQLYRSPSCPPAVASTWQ
ncbi:uncharacterized protein LOC112575591 isoform X2 [Pomacea canaliculata]|uniref:uncharacterized protein LOC112575591 isoform X2 n=1 Tax=Pomacea canaliculata TaxID=400727 RepID=UPI000D72FC09|nr:uncharacterized protein LOC112575591 isoform X2 [Pomacea canaliculata]